MCLHASFSFPNNSINLGFLLDLLMRRFSCRVLNKLHSAQSSFRKFVDSFAPLRLHLFLVCSVWNLRSTRPLYWGLFGLVNSKVIPISSSFVLFSKVRFSPALSHLINFTLQICLPLMSLIHNIIWSLNSSFVFKKILQQ